MFLDGFAGLGVDKCGEAGSPVIALETVYEHPQIDKIKEIKFIFIEENKKRYENLTLFQIRSFSQIQICYSIREFFCFVIGLKRT